MGGSFLLGECLFASRIHKAGTCYDYNLQRCKATIQKWKKDDEESSTELDISPDVSPAPRRTSISLSLRNSLSFRSESENTGHSRSVGDEDSEDTDTVNANYLEAAKQKTTAEAQNEKEKCEELEESSEESEEHHQDYLSEILRELQWETLIFFITLFMLAGELAELRFMQVCYKAYLHSLSRLS